MFRFVLCIAVVCFFISCAQKKREFPQITIHTNYGKIEAELYPAKAPKTVAAFLSYIDKKLYENTSFYRVIKDDDMPTDYNTGLIQGGTWPNLKNVQPILHEPTNISGLSHTSGTLSMARTEANTATTEFFICVGDQINFDAGNSRAKDTLGFAAFGRVIHSMDVVRKIHNTKTNGDQFLEKITITNISMD